MTFALLINSSVIAGHHNATPHAIFRCQNKQGKAFSQGQGKFNVCVGPLEITDLMPSHGLLHRVTESTAEKQLLVCHCMM